MDNVHGKECKYEKCKLSNAQITLKRQSELIGSNYVPILKPTIAIEKIALLHRIR
jgi:hypothetical protein